MARPIKFSTVGRDLTKQVVEDGFTYITNRRKITHISIHCSYSPQGRGDDAHTIDRWHLENGWSGIGYHYVVLEDGTIQKGRWADSIGAGVRGHNRNGIHICRIGGKKDNDAINDTTVAQIKAIRALCKVLLAGYDLEASAVRGHNEYPGVNKLCPLMGMQALRMSL